MRQFSLHSKQFMLVITIALLSTFKATISFGQVSNLKKEDCQLVVEYSSQKLQEDSIKNSKYFKSRGQAYYVLGEQKKALIDFNSFLNLHPEDGGTYYNRGVLKAELNQLKEAVEDLSLALKLNKGNPADIYYARGTVNESLNLSSKAILDYKSSLKYNPRQEDALNNLGIIEMKEGNYTMSIDYFNQALSINPNRVNSLFNRGFTFTKMGNYENAKSDLKKALALSPDNPYANNYMGYLLYKTGEIKKSCKYFKVAQSKGVQPVIKTNHLCE